MSIPVLNNRIRHAQVRDALITPAGVQPTRLGQGNVPIPDFLKRLKGIGYEGWVNLIPSGPPLSTNALIEESLHDGIRLMRQWSTAAVKAPAKKKHAAVVK